MALVRRRLPRGINFLLGGIFAALGVIGVVLFTGGFGISVGGAPDVRIEDTSANITQ